MSDAAAAAEVATPGAGGDALVWEEFEARARDDAALTASFLVFMVIAAAIAAIGILLDSAILVIGAMVVGPDYGPLAAMCVGLVRRRRDPVLGAARTMAIGVVAAACGAFAVIALLRLASVAPDQYVTDRVLTSFISRPDAFAVVVAVLAGVVGMLSLTEGRSRRADRCAGLRDDHPGDREHRRRCGLWPVARCRWRGGAAGRERDGPRGRWQHHPDRSSPSDHPAAPRLESQLTPPTRGCLRLVVRRTIDAVATSRTSDERPPRSGRPEAPRSRPWLPARFGRRPNLHSLSNGPCGGVDRGTGQPGRPPMQSTKDRRWDGVTNSGR